MLDAIEWRWMHARVRKCIDGTTATAAAAIVFVYLGKTDGSMPSMNVEHRREEVEVEAKENNSISRNSTPSAAPRHHTHNIRDRIAHTVDVTGKWFGCRCRRRRWRCHRTSNTKESQSCSDFRCERIHVREVTESICCVSFYNSFGGSTEPPASVTLQPCCSTKFMDFVFVVQWFLISIPSGFGVLVFVLLAFFTLATLVFAFRTVRRYSLDHWWLLRVWSEFPIFFLFRMRI